LSNINISGFVSYFRLSVIEIAVFELAMVDSPRFEVGKQRTVFRLKSLGAFFIPKRNKRA